MSFLNKLNQIEKKLINRKKKGYDGVIFLQNDAKIIKFLLNQFKSRSLWGCGGSIW
jgi:hypothetical protein